MYLVAKIKVKIESKEFQEMRNLEIVFHPLESVAFDMAEFHMGTEHASLRIVHFHGKSEKAQNGI
jgi:hypothetical protein